MPSLTAPSTAASTGWRGSRPSNGGGRLSDSTRTPEQWVASLNAQLDERAPRLAMLDRYYEGDHPLPRGPERAKEAFKRWLKKSRSNWMGLVVDAKAERLRVQGIRYGRDQAADSEAWDIWQANSMDLGSDAVHLEAFIAGETYVSVEPNPDEPATPFIYPEHPCQMIVSTPPERLFQRDAAFKKWTDDDSGSVYATLYLPHEIVKLRSKTKRRSGTVGKIVWEPREMPGEPWPLPNTLGEVPVIPFRNRSRLLKPGRSEMDGLTDTQDRINEMLFQRLIAGQYAAFRQRAASGMALETDPETGKPKMPFEPSMTELWVSEDPETRWHEFTETSLAGYLDSVEADVQHIAAQSATPPHYLLGKMMNLAAEALKAAEAGLVAKVQNRQLHFGESWEAVWRLAFLAAGNEAKAKIRDAEVIWRNPEFRTEGQLVDALVKMDTLGVPREALWERWGASPQEIARWKAMAAEQSLFAALAQPSQPGPSAVPEPKTVGIHPAG